MKIPNAAVVLGAVLVLASACGEARVPVHDAGSASDAGLSSDAGVINDAGLTGDAGSMNDAGLTGDAGSMNDAGLASDAGVAADAGADGGDAVAPSARCATDTMDVLYPGFLPTNPYAPAPSATACVRSGHDVIVLLGCPSNADGTPSACQLARVDIGRALQRAGYADRYIVTGAAVHNGHVEAESLRTQLRQRGVPDAHILVEPLARHTDENLYYSTRLMEARGWETALVVSDDAGHLVMSAVCDSNCCVKKGRLTVFDFSLELDGRMLVKKVGHYALYPYASAVSSSECDQIGGPLKLMCVNLASRNACEGRLRLP